MTTLAERAFRGGTSAARQVARWAEAGDLASVVDLLVEETADVSAEIGYTVTHVQHEATITPYRDGPLLVRGRFRFRDLDGAEIVDDVRRSPCAAVAARADARCVTGRTGDRFARRSFKDSAWRAIRA